MDVCVIGGGNIGTALSAELAYLNPKMSIRLLTSKPHFFTNPISVMDVERDAEFYGTLDIISDDPKESVEGADVIFVTTPSFLTGDIFHKIRNHVKTGAYVGVIPGSGGTEFYWKTYFDESFTLFGLERVPFITRLAEYGKTVHIRSRKPYVTLASFPSDNLDKACRIMSELLRIKCTKAANYLTISLTPSNPVLHTSRIFDLFCNASPDTLYPRNIEFYSEWTERASEVLFGIDNELQDLCRTLSDLDMKGVVSLREHYESPTIHDLTRKICSIPSFKGIYAPLIQTQSGKYAIDVNSRYFTEDFPYGLCIIKGFCEICEVETPYVDRVLRWYQDFTRSEYFRNDEFNGKGLINTAIPQNFGIGSYDDIIDFYK